MPPAPLTPEIINQLEKASRAASPGPWEVLTDPLLACTWLNGPGSEEVAALALFDYRSAEENRADAEFTALTRNHVAGLLVEIKALRARVQELLDANSREVDRRVRAQSERDRALARLKADQQP